MCSALSKLLDYVILEKFENVLVTSDSQFGFKKGHSTTQCSFVVNEVIQYYKNRNSNVYITMLDASKAFDKVNYVKLFKLLIKMDLCPLYCRFMVNLYTLQSLNIKWGNCFSHTFKACNGVKQGGFISPILFGIYIDQLLKVLSNSGFGCYIGKEFYGCMGYADDIVILAPTLFSTNKLLELAYKVGLEYNIMFNVEKTKFINMDKDPNRVKDLHFNDISISACESGEHLNNWIGRNCNSSNIDRTITEFNCMVNYISSTFSFTPFDVKLQLFNTYCTSLYGSVLWDLSNKKCEEFYTQWRKALRKLLSLPKTTASNLIHHICNCHPIDNQLALRFLKFMNMNFTSDNIKVRICGNLALQGSGSAASKTAVS